MLLRFVNKLCRIRKNHEKGSYFGGLANEVATCSPTLIAFYTGHPGLPDSLRGVSPGMSTSQMNLIEGNYEE